MQVDDTPSRVAELWFDDGNIVIQAGNSQFRVYRGILASCSPVFKDMFSFSHPSDSEYVEGCPGPLLRLQDSPEEVTVFFKAIFDSKFFMPFPFQTQFDIIVGVLRLSHKYKVDHLRRRALIHLSSGYATELWRRDSTGLIFNSHVNSGNLRRPPEVDISRIRTWADPKGLKGQRNYALAIQLARQVGALWILPAAFYDLSSWFRFLSREALSEVLTTLGPQDQLIFLVGHDIQTHSSTTDILQYLCEPRSLCTSQTECSNARLPVIASLRQTVLHDPSDPLDALSDDDWDELQSNLCAVCFASIQEAHRVAREKFWDDLPGIYALPPWAELKKMSAEAIGTTWLS